MKYINYRNFTINY